MERALLGAIAAALITGIARRLHTLDESGLWAATVIGAARTIVIRRFVR